MSIITDKQTAARAAQENHRKDLDILSQTANEVLTSGSGSELLSHLWKRFDVEGRSFIPSTDRGEVNTIRAAIRDGERAAIKYIFDLARKANPDLPHP